MSTMTRAEAMAADPRIVIIGAGLGGIAVARELLERGIDDFVMIDRQAGFGGTWLRHHYPNVACDTPVQLYSFEFAPNPDWSSNFAPGAEILEYIEKVADEAALIPHLLADTSVVSCVWDEADARWEVRTTGDVTWTPQYVIAAVGRFSQPDTRPIPGAEQFTGRIFHAADWPDDLDVTGQRVAVVGGGATSIQVVPWAVQNAAEVVAFIPTPSHVLHKPEKVYGAADHQRFRESPEVLEAMREEWHDYYDVAARSRFPFDAAANATAVAAWREEFEAVVKQPALREILTPDYALGCRRLLFSNDYYPSLIQSHVTVVGERLAALRPHAAVDSDGTEYPVDTVILATGYQTNAWLSDVEVVGADGRTLRDEWAEGPSAYLGMMVNGFPNMFLVDGPNVQIPFITEVLTAHARYIATCVQEAGRVDADLIEVRRSSEDEFNRQLDVRLDRSVLARCDSYYRVGHNGRITSHWPGTPTEIAEILAHIDHSAIDYRSAGMAKEERNSAHA